MNQIGQRIPVRDISDLKPSELIRVALEDLVLCAENDAEYEINMGTWHEPYGTGNTTVCLVCLSGAVMAQSLDVATNREVDPNSFDRQTQSQLLMLNHLRMGNLGEAVFYMPDYVPQFNLNGYPIGPLPDRRITGYGKSPILFHYQMLALAADLEEVGY